jgi:hypothetical protein
LIGPDGPYLLHPWWEKGLRENIRVLAAKKNSHGAGKSMTVSNPVLAKQKSRPEIQQENKRNEK